MSILKKYRIENKINQKDMAKKLNCSLEGYRNYETGKRILPPNVLAKFLQLRAYPSDLKLLEALEEFYDKKN